MFFDDYLKTKKVYHIAPINDLKKIFSEGIQYDDKVTYMNKYYDFHTFIDGFKSEKIPSWVVRRKAIFASLNYRSEPNFYAHNVIMSLKINESKCWIANENRANEIYEPFILQNINELKGIKEYIDTKGRDSIKNYWETSLSFEKNLIKRMDLKEGYDAEIMIFHSIPPEDIDILYIVSDHRVIEFDQWKKLFCK